MKTESEDQQIDGRGGAREGAGRPKGRTGKKNEGSQLVRIPNSFVEPIKAMIRAYRAKEKQIKE